ncbi:uncharacterized protein B0H64DRAFT_130264 [Chaetomium fimeti]|uniref:Serine-rich protein n=1 Tax=Chaetomium fimeti TaxID=1854472 RepID=A0AAE0HL92_9PEZI|nr:hypothetical protein B0H64DRAFT_130264 [Chaetomium fimeti]
MSNDTTAGEDVPTSTPSAPDPPETTSEAPPPEPTPSSSEEPPPPPPTTSSEDPPPPPTTESPPPSSTSSDDPPPTSSSSRPPPESSSTPDDDPPPSTSTAYTTVTESLPPTIQPTDSTTAPTSTTGSTIDPTDEPSGGLDPNARTAVAVVVPIAAVAILLLLGIFLWRRRKQRKDAEEQRRKEVEDYGYNPNADPTIPAVAGAAYEMGEDSPSGYRGWGSTTLAGSTTRKASTTMSGGAGASYSDAASPTRADARSGEPLMGDVPPSPEGEILGAMGPSAANNRADVRRGPSNASSSYSAAGRSDGSGDGPIGVAYGGGAGGPSASNQYYDQYGSGNPYTDNGYGGQPADAGGQPVIRDVTARRNTRIENSAHYPQQTAGISQNF